VIDTDMKEYAEQFDRSTCPVNVALSESRVAALRHATAGQIEIRVYDALPQSQNTPAHPFE
jgi:hypothetical protein